jgi:glycosyltransferase involved in cell wall biosynthesis
VKSFARQVRLSEAWQCCQMHNDKMTSRSTQDMNTVATDLHVRQCTASCKRVSIIINNYNYGRYLRQAIESALGQTYNNIELIIVDDGSTDDSRAIIDEYKHRGTVVLKANGGQASAFNAGVGEATGDLIMLLDSDDYLFPEAIATCVKSFPDGYSRLFFRLRVIDSVGARISSPAATIPFMQIDGSAILAAGEGRGFPAVPTSGNIFDAQKLKAALPIPQEEFRICADAYLFVKTAMIGSVRSIEQELGAYRVHGNNHFSPLSPRLLADKNRLAIHLENYYKTTRLIEHACVHAGISPAKYRQRLDHQFYPLHMLCASYASSIENPDLSAMSKSQVMRRISRYLAYGNERPFKRTLQSLYLVLIVGLPSFPAELLMRLMDAWQRRLRG